MTARALVVAVEACGAAGDLDGAARDALRVVDWLVGTGMPGEAITVLCEALPGNVDAVTAAARKVGFALDAPTHRTVHRHLDETLAGIDGDALFVYWSGHGFLQQDRTMLYYSDSSPNAHRALDVSAMLHRLRHRDYRFDEQYFVIDACRQYGERQGLPAVLPYAFSTGQPRDVPQEAVFAVQRGGVAMLSPGAQTSWFTEALLVQLDYSWPPGLAQACAVIARDLKANGAPVPVVFTYQPASGEPQVVAEHREGPCIAATEPVTIATMLARIPAMRRPERRLDLVDWLADISPFTFQPLLDGHAPSTVEIVNAACALPSPCTVLLDAVDSRPDLFPPEATDVQALRRLLGVDLA